MFHDADPHADRDDEPLFAASFVFQDPSQATINSLVAWGNSMGVPADVTVKQEGGLVRVARRCFLAELVLAGATFPEQVNWLAEWAGEAVLSIVGAPPPDAPTIEPLTT